jgi:hypothetical protein
MTRLLEEAIAKVRQLSETEQNAIARLVLDEVESERQWDERFANSTDKLRKLADKAWAEHEAGQSEDLDPEKL